MLLTTVKGIFASLAVYHPALLVLYRVLPPCPPKGGLIRYHVSGKYWEIASPASRDRNDRQLIWLGRTPITEYTNTVSHCEEPATKQSHNPMSDFE